MCSSPAEATTESAPSRAQQDRVPEGAAGGGSWFKRWSRRILVMAVVSLLVGALLLTITNRKTHSGGGVSNSLSVPDSSRAIRLKGSTEAVDARAVLAPLLAGQELSTLPITD